MKYVNMKMRKVIAVLMLTLVFAAFSTNVFADEIDLSRKGSISVTFKDGATGNVIPDGVLSLYKVANIQKDDANLSYVYTNDFASCELVLGDLKSETLPTQLSAYVTGHKLVALTQQSINDKGVCFFDELEPGLYLVVQTKAANGYYPVSPFLVSVPISTTEGWVYDVEASPKMEKGTAISTNSTSSTTTTTTTTRNSNIQGENDKLPQTGQLNWPVPVLAGVGILLFLFGWSVVFSGKKERR